MTARRGSFFTVPYEKFLMAKIRNGLLNFGENRFFS
ncbi:hypothetical protein CLOLEP_03639 [[Clostridium] leptum DSM 753]|uniref:Uncharacterized protein n=1 Tax=[Clostridium] leptum DSM 753 TaxID=428125 RepID=A7VYG1_9FIRM|nr:hypothetical protein CLOLEP_03639 [[Clostridium] leptum DSM 753]